MKTITKPERGKVMVHHYGMGDIARVDIESRARELAVIDGRRTVTKGDRVRAERELRGQTVPPTGDVDASAARAVTRDPSEPASQSGDETPIREGADESKVPERLVLEGVEEAQHEQMLAARRNRRRGR